MWTVKEVPCSSSRPFAQLRRPLRSVLRTKLYPFLPLLHSRFRSSQQFSQQKLIFQAYWGRRCNTVSGQWEDGRNLLRVQRSLLLFRWKEAGRLASMAPSPSSHLQNEAWWCCGHHQVTNTRRKFDLVRKENSSPLGPGLESPHPVFSLSEKDKSPYADAAMNPAFWFSQWTIIEFSNWKWMVRRIRSNCLAQCSALCGCSYLWTLRYFKG